MNHKAGIWIDHKKAVAVSASASGVTVKTLESEVGPSLHESVEMKDGVTERAGGRRSALE